MKRIFKNYRLPEYIEVLFLLIIGIILQVTDGSPFTINQRWAVVWDTELPSEYFSVFVQHFIKTILAGIVVARSLMTYVYVVSAMLVIFCILKDSAPRIILIWLAVSGLKSICMTFVEALIGVYVCSAFGKIRKACVEFFISKALEITFATYLWGSVLNKYYDMIRRRDESNKIENWDEYFKKMCFKRQRARSLVDESILSKTANLNNFEFKDVPQIMLQMLRREEDMSQDSLLGTGMMMASVSHMGSFDNIKKAQSLGELGTFDLRYVRVMDMDEDELNTPAQKALKFLKLSWSDVRMAKERKNEDNKYEDYKNIFSVDDKTWMGVTNDPEHVHQPKEKRADIVVQEIPHSDLDEEIELKREKLPKIELQLKFGFSLFNFLKEKDDEYLKGKEEEGDEEEEDAEEQEEDEKEKQREIFCANNPENEKCKEKNIEDDDSARIFMSNIKEEVAVNRIRLEFVAIKGNNYEKLYKQDYMSTIGHEVFDTASKLPKVTSLSQVLKKYGRKGASSLQNSSDTSRKRKKSSNDGESTPRSSLSLSNLETFKEGELKNIEAISNSFESLTDTESSQGNENELSKKIDSADVEKIAKKRRTCSIPSKKSRDRESTAIKVKDLWIQKILERAEKPRTIQLDGVRRKINIKILEELLKIKPEVSNDPSCDDGSSTPGRPISFFKKTRSTTCEAEVQKSFSSSSPNSSASTIYKEKEVYRASRQACSVSKFTPRPAENFLTSYNDLKKKYFLEKLKIKRKNLENLEGRSSSLQRNNVGNRVWKSKVLKTAAIYRRAIEKSEGEFSGRQNGTFNTYYFLESNSGRSTFYLMLYYLKHNKKDTELNKMESRSLFTKKIESKPFVLVKDRFGVSNFEQSKGCITSRSSYMSLMLNKSLIHSYTSLPAFGNDSTDQRRSTSKVLRWVNSSFSDDSNITNIDKPKEHSATKSKKSSKLTNYDSKALDHKEVEYPSTPNTSKKVNFRVKSKCSNEGKKDEEEDGSVTGADSDESFSLFYSKAADLASPLLDMKRFIYPDHIHYSYKHVKKKGFDVDISGGLPLLVRESLTTSLPFHVKNLSSTSRNTDVKITRRPMDLSFAATDEFAEWQYPDSTDNFAVEESAEFIDNEKSEEILERPKAGSLANGKEAKTLKKSREYDQGKLFVENYRNQKTQNNIRRTNSSRNNFLTEKLFKIYRKLGYLKGSKLREAQLITSGQFQLSRGRNDPVYNRAATPNENESRAAKRAKKKPDIQEKRHAY